MSNPARELPDSRRIHSLEGKAAAWANALLGALAGVELYGVEKSFKMGRGQILADRFLVGLQPPAWPRLELDRLFKRLAMPPRTQAMLAADLPKANFLGLAFEEGVGRRLFKAYVEFPVPTRRLPGPRPDTAQSHTIYHGYKWDPDRAEDAALARYWWTPGLTSAEIQACLSRHLETLSLPEIRATPQALLARCSERAEATRFQYLEAREDGTSRSSFDLNLYAAEMSLGSVADIVRPAGSAFGIAPQMLDTFLAGVSDRILGHVSAGIDRDGTDFLTLYYEH